jgi:hypothetical protein
MRVAGNGLEPLCVFPSLSPELSPLWLLLPGIALTSFGGGIGDVVVRGGLTRRATGRPRGRPSRVLEPHGVPGAVRVAAIRAGAWPGRGRACPGLSRFARPGAGLGM